MSNPNNTTQLALARKCIAALNDPQQDLEMIPYEWWVALTEQFNRLYDKEQKQIAAGKLGAKHGIEGGRPKKAKE
ncbi:hypothetical protein [Bacteriophage sp.]|nr:hypothetical protein [Bacteriophage sp.]